jgi:CRP/FNR family transcriptional regulator, cyclic AMP receptor protein
LNLEQVLSARATEFAAQLADPWQWVALAAAIVAGAFIVGSTLVKTIVPLRWLAVGGNVGFVVYGLVHPAPMVFVLHAVLLPINLWRVLEMQRLTRRVQRAASLGGEELKVWLQPFMKRRRLKPGAVLFRQGEPADRLYVLVEGQLELVETGRCIEAGEMFGEIAFFSPAQKRTATVRCLRAATLLSIDEVAFRQVFYQNPAFGFEVARLITERLSEDVQRLQAQRDAALAVPRPGEPARVES